MAMSASVGFFCFLFLLYAVGLWSYMGREERRLKITLKQIRSGDYFMVQEYEGEPMPHDMNALMWYDL